MELTAEHREHVHSRERLALDKDGNVMTIDFDADGFFERSGAGLMRRLIEHGSETEELAGRGLVHDDFLVVFIHGRNTHSSGNHHVSSSAWVADLIDPLARNEGLQFYLSRQDGSLLFIQQGKERNIFQNVWVARHRSPRSLKCGSRRSKLRIS